MMRSAVYVLLAASALWCPGANGSQGEIEIAFEIQSCQTKDFSFTLDDDALHRLDSCKVPVTHQRLSLYADGTLQAQSTSNRDGRGRLGPVKVSQGTQLTLSICDDDFCFKFSALRAGIDPATPGDHFVLYEDGQVEERKTSGQVD